MKSYPRYFGHIDFCKDGDTDLLVFTSDERGYIIRNGVPQREGLFNIRGAEANVKDEFWIEGTEYGPFQSDLSWKEYYAVRQVVKRLTGITKLRQERATI